MGSALEVHSRLEMVGRVQLLSGSSLAAIGGPRRDHKATDKGNQKRETVRLWQLPELGRLVPKGARRD